MSVPKGTRRRWLRPLGTLPNEPIELVDENTTIGRGPSNVVVAFPRSVSTIHAQIELLQGGGAVLHDLGADGTGSRFGSFVGDEHFVGGWRELVHGDIVRLGTVQHGAAYRFEEEGRQPLPPIVQEESPQPKPMVIDAAPVHFNRRRAQPPPNETNSSPSRVTQIEDGDPVVRNLPSKEAVDDALSPPEYPSFNLPEEAVPPATAWDDGGLSDLPTPPLLIPRQASIERARQRSADSVRRLNQALAGVRPFSDVQDELSSEEVSQVVEEIRKNDLSPKNTPLLEELQQYLALLVPKLDGLLAAKSETDATNIQKMMSDLKTDVCRVLRDTVRQQMRESLSTHDIHEPSKSRQSVTPQPIPAPSQIDRSRPDDDDIDEDVAVRSSGRRREPRDSTRLWAQPGRDYPPLPHTPPRPDYPPPQTGHSAPPFFDHGQQQQPRLAATHAPPWSFEPPVVAPIQQQQPQAAQTTTHALSSLQATVQDIRQEIRTGRDEAKQKELQDEVRGIKTQLSEVLLRQQLSGGQQQSQPQLQRQAEPLEPRREQDSEIINTLRRDVVQAVSNVAQVVDDASKRQTSLLQAVENELRRRPEKSRETLLPPPTNNGGEKLVSELQNLRQESALRHESLLAAVKEARQERAEASPEPNHEGEQQKVLQLQLGGLEAALKDARHDELKAQLSNYVAELRRECKEDPAMVKSELRNELRAMAESNREQLSALRAELVDNQSMRDKSSPRFFDDAASIRSLVREELDRSLEDKSPRRAGDNELTKLAGQMMELRAQTAETHSLVSEECRRRKKRVDEDDDDEEVSDEPRRRRKRWIRGEEDESLKASFEGHVSALRDEIRGLQSSGDAVKARHEIEALAERVPTLLKNDVAPILDEMRRLTQSAVSSSSGIAELRLQVQHLTDRVHQEPPVTQALESMKHELAATRDEVRDLKRDIPHRVETVSPRHSTSDDIVQVLKAKEETTAQAMREQLATTREELLRARQADAAEMTRSLQEKQQIHARPPEDDHHLDAIKEQLRQTQEQLRDVMKTQEQQQQLAAPRVADETVERTVEAVKQQLASTQDQLRNLVERAVTPRESHGEVDAIKSEVAETRTKVRELENLTPRREDNSLRELVEMRRQRETEAEIARCCEKLFAERSLKNENKLESVEAQLRELRDSMRGDERTARLEKLERELEAVKTERSAETERARRAFDEMTTQLNRGGFGFEAEVRKLRESHEQHAGTAQRALEALQTQLSIAQQKQLLGGDNDETDQMCLYAEAPAVAPREGDEAAAMASLPRVRERLHSLTTRKAREAAAADRLERLHLRALAEARDATRELLAAKDKVTSSLEDRLSKLGEKEAAEQLRQAADQRASYDLAALTQLKALEERFAKVADDLERKRGEEANEGRRHQLAEEAAESATRRHISELEDAAAARHRDEVERMTRRGQELEERLCGKRDEIEKMRTDHREELDEIKRQRDEVVSASHRQRDELESVSRKHDDAIASTASLAAQVSAKSQELSELRQELTSAKYALEEKKRNEAYEAHSRSELAENNKRLQRELSHTKSLLKDRESRISGLQSQVAKIAAETGESRQRRAVFVLRDALLNSLKADVERSEKLLGQTVENRSPLYP